MSYTNREDRIMVDPTMAAPVVDYHDRVRWGPIIAGLVTAIAAQLILSALGAAIGLSSIAGSGAPRTDAPGVGNAVGIWSIISLFISLFLGSWVASRASGPMNRSTALLNGAILWATTLALSSWLLASGVAGAFGVLGSNAGEIINQVQQPGGIDPATLPNANLNAQETRNVAGNAAEVGWYFTIGSLLGLAASLIGASIGARTPRRV